MEKEIINLVKKDFENTYNNNFDKLPDKGEIIIFFNKKVKNIDIKIKEIF